MRFATILSCAVAVAACSSNGAEPTTATNNAGGGRTGPTVGGATSQGGNPDTGGTLSNSSGGSGGSGGASTTGRTSASGGSEANSTATGGTTSAGGSKPMGGNTATGGEMPTGGTTSAGGSKPMGGNTATGGEMPTGGTTSAGGTAKGGMTSNGGSTAGGGASGEGGSTLPPIIAVDAGVAMGKGVNIGQTFESTQNERTLASVSARIDAYYAKGFRNVRIPITWTEQVGGDLLVGSATMGDVNRSHSRLAVIKQVVDYALSKSGLYVVINAHHESGLKTNNRAAVLEHLWADIAAIFAAKDHRLLFEILNEPHRSDGSNSALPAADLRTMVRMAYAKIRAVDPARIVLIGGNQWFAASEMANVWTDLSGVGDGQDPYLMATFHHYDPWTFCGDNQGTYDDAWTDANLSTPMETMLSWAKSVGHSMPVYIGEWGVGWASRYTTMDCNNIRSWYQKMVATASDKGIPTSLWDDNGWFKVFDIRSNSWNNNLVDCMSGTCSWNGTDRFNAGCK
jgi:endoglucanase